jgi:hypothetical protein
VLWQKVYHIQSQADTSFLPKYDGVKDMTTTLQHLHMSDLLTHDDEGVDENGPNDIDYVRMLPGQTNDDFTIGGSAELQQRIRKILHEYEDIFSFNVKGKAMLVPPMEFTVDKVRWEAPANRLPSRHISVEKHAALNKMIDDLLNLEVIQPSRATAWSQANPHDLPSPI